MARSAADRSGPSRRTPSIAFQYYLCVVRLSFDCGVRRDRGAPGVECGDTENVTTFVERSTSDQPTEEAVERSALMSGVSLGFRART